MKNKICLLLLIFTLISCNKSKKENQKTIEKNKTEITKSNKDSIIVPTFEIQLNLTQKAEKKLKDENESVIIDVEFIGEPNKRIIETKKFEIYDENGDLTIGSKRVELEKERTIKFENCKVSKSLLKLLKNKTYEVRINVFSGRKSSEDNLIDCDFLQENIELIKNKRITLNGKLIYGE
ncbi:hypothetical protein AAEO57_20770 [Flavobacterium sp. DGU38]|uniref:Lipoprotein n=1 Tax=Flavobacterium calami TaxID=3139144 RepID=A0ABU9IVT4_9FLAO